MTCLGSGKGPPYHIDSAFHRESGTSSKSLPCTNVMSFLRRPPSPVSVETLHMGSATRLELSMGPGWPKLLFKPVPELLDTPELEAMLQLQDS